MEEVEEKSKNEKTRIEAELREEGRQEGRHSSSSAEKLKDHRTRTVLGAPKFDENTDKNRRFFCFFDPKPLILSSLLLSCCWFSSLEASACEKS